jgi:hypothetical protein
VSDPRPELIADAIVSRLAAIVGDDGATYHFTPGLVRRAHVIVEGMLDSTVDPLYFVTPDRKEESRRTSLGVGGIIRGRAYLTVSLFKRHVPATERPHLAEAPTRWTLEERMQADVRKALREDPHLGGVSSSLELVESEDGNADTEIAGWAMTFMRVIATYHYRHEIP